MELKMIIIGYALAIIIVSISGIILLKNLPPLPPQINIFACQNDFDCQTQMKCLENKCLDVGCVGEDEKLPGAIAPVYLEHMATECCPGLTKIDWPQNYDSECNTIPLVGAPAGVCTKCGDKICQGMETICNCPVDCQN